ncbi:MAG: GNAT family N-acetyltransferase [Anaerolineae bacterium]|nr:GNAT family N-acetyltransferase [Anaerolineae bacterium]
MSEQAAVGVPSIPGVETSMKIVELSQARLPAALEAIRRIGYDPRLDLAWLRYRTLDDPTCPPELMLLAEQGGQIVGFCLGGLRDGKGMLKLFGVTPEFRRRGIATALFGELEARMGARGVSDLTVGALGPNFFEPGVEVRRTDMISFLLQRGYTTDRVARINMDVDLASADLDASAAQARLASAGIAVRRASAADVRETAQFALDCFSEGWQFEVSEAARFSPIPLFVALDGERVAAFAAYDVTGPGRFGPTGTHPDYRGRGIGRTLLRLCLRSLRERGDAMAEIIWVGPVAFYARTVGARINRVFWSFTKALRTVESERPSTAESAA